MHYHFSNDDFSYNLLYPDGEDKLLAEFYCEVSFAENSKQPIPREIMPFPGCEIVIYITGSASLITEETTTEVPPCFILGQPSATRTYLIKPGTTIFFIRVKQHLLKSILHDTSNWKDILFLPDDKIYKGTTINFSSITGNSFEERIKAAQQVILDLCKLTPDKNFEWLQSVEAAVKNAQSVAEVAKQTHTIVRQLERRFKSYFDISPKDFIRVNKLAEALNHYARNAGTSVTDASYEGGFADQSHFIKTFKLYAKEAPLKFFRKYNIKKK